MLNLVVQLETCGSYSSQLQLKALSLCEGCHYQRSWHVELRFGRPESHLRWALKPADLSTLRKMLESLDDVFANVNMFKVHFSGVLENVRFLTLVRILERISRTQGSFVDLSIEYSMESWKSFEGPQLPQKRPVATWDGHFHWEALWILSLDMCETVVSERVSFPYFFLLQFPDQEMGILIKSIWKCPFRNGSFYRDGVEGVVKFDVNSFALGGKTDALSGFEISQVWLLILLYVIDN